jgi:hypothetical protein
MIAACHLNGQGLAETLPPEEAAKRVGTEVEMRGTVFSTGFTQAKSGNWYKNLFFGDDTPRHVFRVRYRHEGLPGAERLPENLVLREVRVRGKVESAEEGGRITVADVNQIEVLPLDVEAVLAKAVNSAPERLIYAAACGDILMRGDYEVLERQAEKLNKTETRFLDGQWQLHAFMMGVSKPETKLGEDWRARDKALRGWGKAFPNSATQKIAWAAFLIDAAWRARGSGYAKTVSEEGWKLFKERLGEAAKVLNDLPRAEWSPYAYSRWGQLAMGAGLSTEEAQKSFAEGAQRWPEYYDLYFAEAMRLLPRWHGKAGEWEEWLAEQTAEGNAISNEIYARVVWSLTEYHKEGGGIFKATKADWGRVKLGFEAMRRRFPESWWNLNAFAKMSQWAGDRTTALELIKDLEGHEDTSFWKGWTYYEGFKRWAEEGGE